MKTNEDRIYDAYYGEYGTQATQERARDRVHWIASQVVGERVLDVGCSQGLIPLLLGREGYQVIGVDVRPEAIEFANKQLDQEPPAVRELVRFEVADAATMDPPQGGCDTIIMGEILEHQTQPERLLEAAERMLRPDGKVVITVPFGIHPDPDHKRTLYLSDLVDLVSSRFSVAEVFIRNKYICCTAVRAKKSGKTQEVDATELLHEAERAFLWVETESRKELKEARDIVHATKMAGAEKTKKYDAYARLALQMVEKLSSLHAVLASSQAARLLLAAGPKGEAAAALKAWIQDGGKKEADIAGVPRIMQQLVTGLVLSLEKLSEVHQGAEQRLQEKTTEHKRVAQELEKSQQRLAGREALFEQVTAELDRSRKQLGELRGAKEKRIELEQQLDHKNWLIHQKDHSIEEKKARLRQLEKQLKASNKKSEEMVQKHRIAVKAKTGEIRYKLGDALVSSLYNPSRIPALPFKMAGLFVEGLKKVKTKRRIRARKQNPDRQPAAPAPVMRPAPRQESPPARQVEPSSEAPAGAPAAPTPARSLMHRPVIPRVEVPVACILDEFSMENYRHECDLFPLSAKNWQQEMERRSPAFLLVESAWFGNSGAWQYRITYSKPRPDNPLFALLAFCRDKEIPTVFWNKEDPPNYDRFIDAARRFDHVFTSDANCVERYHADAPDSKIHTLPFAAQPIIHNPVNVHRFEKLGDICFAGAWYPRHPERFEDARLLLEASREYDLHIYDRYLNHPLHERYLFPEDYQPFIKGSLSYEEMLEKYRQYRLFLNVNSVKDSPTMFSRRVLEILACGTPVVSGYAKGIEELLGADIVPMCTSTGDAKRTIDRMMSDSHYRDSLVVRGQRRIFAEHTYRDRIRQICEVLGVDLKEEPDRVSVITATIRKDFVDNLLENYKRQTFANKDLLVVINAGKELTKDHIHQRAQALGVPDVKVVETAQDTTLGACLNRGIEESRGNIFAKMDDDDHYGAHYLEDAVQALGYSGADCVGKESYFTYSEELDQVYLQAPNRQHKLTKFVIGTTLVAKRGLYPEVEFGDTRVGEDTIFLKAIEKAGKKLYSHNQYNYIKFFARSREHHTWKVDRDQYLKGSTFVCDSYNHEACCC